MTELNVENPLTLIIYKMIHFKKLPKTSMKRLIRKLKFKRPAEKRGEFNDKRIAINKIPKQIYKKGIRSLKAYTVESSRINHKRKSNYSFVILVENRKSENVTPAIINVLKDFPKNLVKNNNI